MKKMKITALLLALIMLLQPVLVSADAAGVSLEDYMGFINNAQNYGLIDSAYEYYVQQLEGKTVAERYQTLKRWHEGLLGDLFYENFIAYYEKAHAGENLVCVCGVPCEYGNIAHTNPACQWYFGNLPLTEQHDILSGLEGDAKAAYEAVLPADTLDKLNRYNVRTLTAAADDVSVQINVPTGAFAEDYILSASSASLSDEAAAAVAAAVEEGLGSEVLGAFDISFLSVATDDKLQPGAPVGLSFTVDMPAMEDAENAPEVRLVVYHITEKDGALVAEPVGEKVADLTAAQQTVEVEAKAFSMYVVGEVGEISTTVVKTAYVGIGETIVIYSDASNPSWDDAWGSSSNLTWTVDSNNRKYVTVTANGAGTLTLYDGTGSIFSRNAIQIIATGVHTITFKQGSVGTAATKDMPTENAGAFTFPTPEEMGIPAPEGMKFAGWSEKEDGKGLTYSAGLGMNVKQNMTYYAQWYDPDAENNTSENEAYFYIRIDGKIPYEPDTSYSTSSYLPSGSGHTTNNDGYLRSPVSITNNLTAVKNNLAVSPTLTEIDAFLGNNRVTVDGQSVQFDPDIHDVVWYAIKYDCGNKPVSHFHVDGIVIAKNQYIVTYHPNMGTSNVPQGAGYYPDATVTVEFEPIPSRTGWVFMGWDRDPSASSPEYPMDGNTYTFKMPSANVDLYAIWRPSDATPYKVEHYWCDADGNNAVLHETEDKYGTTEATATAEYKTYAGYEAYPGHPGTVSSGVIAAEGTLVLKLYYKQSTGDLVINKTVQDSTFTSGNRTFIFTVNGEEKTMTVPYDTKTGTVTFTDLVAGNYTVTESHDGKYATKMGNTNGTTTTVTINAGQTTTLDVVNTAHEDTTITVTKVWNDNSNNLGKRPASVTLTVHASSEVQDQTVVLTAENAVDANTNTWSTTLTVPKFDANGNEITYTVNEANAPDFYNKTAQSGLEVTNSVNVGSLMISKKVIDEHRLYTDTVRTFSFKIKQGDAFIQENGADKVWTVAIDTLENNAEQTNRLTVAELQPGKYTVEELPYNGYVATKREVEVTVAAGHVVEAAFENTVKTVNIPVTKTWEDLNDKYKVRPARITVALTAKYADGTAADSKYNKSITIDATTDWKREFQNVAIYDANGGALTYAVTETLAANAEFYTIPEIAGVDPKDEKPQIAITNSIKLGSLTITKTVVDPSGKYADDLTFEFTVTGKHNYNEKHTVTVKKTDDYTGSVRIPQLLIGEYTVIETVPDNYDLTSVTVGDTAIENGGNVAITYDNAPQTTTVTFTNTVKTVDIPVTKIWVDESNKLDTRPESIDLTLTGKVGETAVVTKTQKLTAANAVSGNANQWEFTFEKLPVYTAAGDQITYTVDEARVSDYKKSINGYVITNTLLSTTLTITKEGCDEKLDAGQSFLFRVTSTNGVDLMIAINGNGSETISDLLVGDVVTVTEIEEWSWRYTGAAQTITLVDGTNTVKITNTRDNPYWLDGDCYAENNFAVQGN